MSVTITELRTLIAAALNTEGIRATPLITDQVNPPQAVVYRKALVYDDVQHNPGDFGAHTYQFGVTVYAGRVSERTSQDLLDELAEPVGDRSVKRILESDDDIAMECDYILVTTVGEVQIVTIGSVDYLMQDFTLQVAMS